MELASDMTQIILRITLVGGLAGLVGGLVGSMRASLFGSFLMGAMGGVAVASIVNISGLDPFSPNPLMDAGGGFSYAWAAIGGVFLGYVVTKSSGTRSVRASRRKR
jgi:hypothetical protein